MCLHFFPQGGRNGLRSDGAPTVMCLLITRKKEMLAVARAQENSVAGWHMNLLVIEQQVELTPMNDDELIIVLKSGSARATRGVLNVSDHDGAATHPQVFSLDIQQSLGPGS